MDWIDGSVSRKFAAEMMTWWLVGVLCLPLTTSGDRGNLREGEGERERERE